MPAIPYPCRKVILSQKRVQAFIAKVRGDNSLQENLKVAGDIEAVIAIANAAGYSINAEDISNAKPELNNEELGGVAGRLIYQWMATKAETAEPETLAAWSFNWTTAASNFQQMFARYTIIPLNTYTNYFSIAGCLYYLLTLNNNLNVIKTIAPA